MIPHTPRIYRLFYRINQKTNRNSWSVNRNDQTVWFTSKGCCTVLVCRIVLFFVLKILVNEYPPKNNEKANISLFISANPEISIDTTKRPASAFEVMRLKTTCFLVIKLYYLCCMRESMHPMQSVHKGLCCLLCLNLGNLFSKS